MEACHRRDVGRIDPATIASGVNEERVEAAGVELPAHHVEEEVEVVVRVVAAPAAIAPGGRCGRLRGRPGGGRRRRRRRRNVGPPLLDARRLYLFLTTLRAYPFLDFLGLTHLRFLVTSPFLQRFLAATAVVGLLPFAAAIAESAGSAARPSPIEASRHRRRCVGFASWYFPSSARWVVLAESLRRRAAPTFPKGVNMFPRRRRTGALLLRRKTYEGPGDTGRASRAHVWERRVRVPRS